jgi:hypothetical protein
MATITARPVPQGPASSRVVETVARKFPSSRPRGSRRAPHQQPLQRILMQPSARNVMHFLSGWRQRETFDLHAPYQRGSVWKLEQRQKLIQSLLRGLPVGSIITNLRGPADAQYHVVDGKQRIEALRAFDSGNVPVPAWWWADTDLIADGVSSDGMMTHSALSERGIRRFENLSIGTLEAQVPTIEAEAELFALINTAGTDQESDTIEAARGITAS